MSYIVVGCTVVSIGMSVVGNQASKKQAEKNRELQKQLFLTQIAMDEKIALEKLRIEREIATTGMLVTSLLDYRKTLQVESTARLHDTGIYVAMLGVSMSSIYGIYLMASKD